MQNWWLGRRCKIQGRCKGEECVGKGCGMSSEDKGYGGIKIVVQSLINTSSFTLLIDFTDISTPLILIWHWLTMTHTQPWGSYPTPHQVKSSDQVIFPFYLKFPMMSHCVSFYYSFSFWFIIWFIMLFWKGTFLEFSSDSLMSNHLLISEMLLSHSGFPSCI